jgi:DNA-binding NarL/FixJ family response regulator
MSNRAGPVVRTEALATLAELRLAQGQLEETARLLQGIEDNLACIGVHAALRLARGELVVAGSILRRRLDDIGETLESATLLELLTEVDVEQGAVEAARTHAERLAAAGASSRCDLVRARGERALGRALVAGGGSSEAISHLERARETFARLELPLEAARTRLLLARALRDVEHASAIHEGRGALACFEALGAAHDADAAAAFLRSLGVNAARSGTKGTGGLTKRELEVLELLGEGLSNRELAERLCLTRKTVENHVARVLAKLELRRRAEAAAYAVRHSSARQ